MLYYRHSHLLLLLFQSQHQLVKVASTVTKLCFLHIKSKHHKNTRAGGIVLKILNYPVHVVHVLLNRVLDTIYYIFDIEYRRLFILFLIHGINYHIFYFYLLYYGVLYSRLFIFYHAGYSMWRSDGFSLLRMLKTIWCSCNLEYWRLFTFYEASKMKEDWWLYILYLVYCFKIYLFLCKYGVIKTFFSLKTFFKLL